MTTGWLWDFAGQEETQRMSTACSTWRPVDHSVRLWYCVAVILVRGWALVFVVGSQRSDVKRKDERAHTLASRAGLSPGGQKGNGTLRGRRYGLFSTDMWKVRLACWLPMEECRQSPGWRLWSTLENPKLLSVLPSHGPEEEYRQPGDSWRN